MLVISLMIDGSFFGMGKRIHSNFGYDTVHVAKKTSRFTL
jgi:hypothetical protein